MNPTVEQRGPRLSVDELRKAAAEMRSMAIVDIFAAGSGHPGGSLSIMDVAAALYLRVLNHDPNHPDWPDRDRVFWSAGHKAPALYVSLGRAGYFHLDDTVLLRQLGTPFEGHPNWQKVPGIEVSSGSLGQGLGIAVGNALAARLQNRPSRIYCLMGDGEQQEGSVWEAAMSAGQFKLDNLCAVVDKNQLQIDGPVKDVMDIDPLADKYRAFKWNVIEIDGHHMPSIIAAFEQAARTSGAPTLIIARTVKGKGVSFMENQAGWHGVAPNKDQLREALAELKSPAMTPDRVSDLLLRADANARGIKQQSMQALPRFKGTYWWNATDAMRVDMDPTRMGFGRALEKAGEDPRVVTLHADISGSIRIADFEAKHPERGNRVFSVGIAEQNMMAVAAGLAKDGLVPVTGTYGVFASGRAWDQLRTTICYSNLNVKVAGAHGGISVGADGATHQALEEIALMAALPNMHLEVPCDSVETERATVECLLRIDGPCYIRFAREATPVVTNGDTPYRFGTANVIRFREAQPRFIDAFEHYLSPAYASEREEATIIACGPMVAEAMRAAWILQQEFGIDTRVLNVHTVKPLDVPALASAADDTGLVVTAEEHQVGGFGNIVAGAILRHRARYDRPLLLDMIGVKDRFGVSGQPWELMRTFELSAEHIAARVKALYDRRAAGKPAAITIPAGQIECQSCHTRVPFPDFLAEFPFVEESCKTCDHRNLESCRKCLNDRLLTEPGFVYVCRDCRWPVTTC